LSDDVDRDLHGWRRSPAFDPVRGVPALGAAVENREEVHRDPLGFRDGVVVVHVGSLSQMWVRRFRVTDQRTRRAALFR
jgi:hypothetical protein